MAGASSLSPELICKTPRPREVATPNKIVVMVTISTVTSMALRAGLFFKKGESIEDTRRGRFFLKEK